MTGTMDAMVELLTGVLDKSKIYPEVVPSTVQTPYIRYSENSEPDITYDGNAGDTVTTVVTVCASTKTEAKQLADAIVSALNMRTSGGYNFYLQGREYTLYDAEKISSYDITFKIL